MHARLRRRATRAATWRGNDQCAATKRQRKYTFRTFSKYVWNVRERDLGKSPSTLLVDVVADVTLYKSMAHQDGASPTSVTKYQREAHKLQMYFVLHFFTIVTNLRTTYSNTSALWWCFLTRMRNIKSCIVSRQNDLNVVLQTHTRTRQKKQRWELSCSLTDTPKSMFFLLFDRYVYVNEVLYNNL